MSTRSEVESIFNQVATDLNSNPVQQMNALSGDTDSYNQNVHQAQYLATKAAILALADKIDQL